MRLSNIGKVLILLCIAVSVPGCGSSETPAPNAEPAGVPAQPKEFPFSVKEPEVYQAEFIVTTAGANQKWFAARKGNSWRIDTFSGEQPIRSEINQNGTYYLVDHRARTYRTQPVTSTRRFIGSLAEDFFRGKENFNFEELGRENGLVRYRAKRSADAKGEVVITVDEKAGMIVRQEFISPDQTGNTSSQFTYEVRNLKLEAEDPLFALPAGYKADKGEKPPAAASPGAN